MRTRMGNHWMSVMLALLLVFAFASVGRSQYGGEPAAKPAPGGKMKVLVPTPRMADGHIDLSGTWSNLGLAGAASPDDTVTDSTSPDSPASIERRTYQERYGPIKNTPITPPLLTDWARRIWQYNQDSRNPGGLSPVVDEENPGIQENGLGAREELDPWFDCVSLSTPRLVLSGGLDWTGYEILQTPQKVVFIYESDHTVREIYTDGRGHGADPILTYRGDSVGHWEGDTLVVETVNLRNDQWLDGQGHVASTGLKMIERIERPDRDTLRTTVTLIDPKTFKQPYTTVKLQARRDWGIQENVRCRFGDEKWQQEQTLFNQSLRNSEGVE